MRDNARLAQHVSDLAASFNVRLDVRQGMDPGAAGAGLIIETCPGCNQRNRIPRRGTARCGRCRHPLGTQDAAHFITIAPVTDEATYAVALHELGHCLAVLGMVNCTQGSDTMRKTNVVSTLRDMQLQLEEERAAWEWAEHHALEWTDMMSYVRDLGLNSYKKRARQLGIKGV